MKVSELIELLQAQDPNADVSIRVGWAHDTAIGTGSVNVEPDGKTVIVSDWLDNCTTELEFENLDVV